MRKAKVSLASFLAISMVVLGLIAPTSSKVDPFWNNFDNYVRPNIPDPELRSALVDAVLIDVLPTSKEIQFTYQLVDGGQARITLQMSSDGNLKNVQGQIFRKTDQNANLEYTDEEIAEIIGELFPSLPIENLKKIEKSQILTGFRYQLIYKIPEHPSVTYLVDCKSDAEGHIEIDRSEYFSLPPMERSRMKSISQEKLEKDPENSKFMEELLETYPGLIDSTIINVSKSFPYFSVLFSMQEEGQEAEVLLIVEYNSITHQIFEISREQYEIDSEKKQQIKKVLEDAVQLVKEIHEEVDKHVGKTIIIEKEDKPDVTVYTDQTQQPFVQGTPIVIEQYSDSDNQENQQHLDYVREIIIDNDQKRKEIVVDKVGKVIEEITPIGNGGFVFSENDYEEGNKHNVISVEIYPEDNAGVKIGNVIRQTITPIIVTKEDQRITDGEEISTVIIDENREVSETHTIIQQQEEVDDDDSEGRVVVSSQSSSSQLANSGLQIEEEKIVVKEEGKNVVKAEEKEIHDEEAQRPRQKNCLRFNGNYCIRCFNRYYLDQNGVCNPVQNECERYNDYTGECYECYHGYIISFGLCIEIDPLCAKSDFYGQCIKCYKNYHLSKGKCFKDNGNADQVIPLCKVATENGKCVECEEGAYLVRQECKIIDPQCQIFNYERRECEICNRGFYPDGENCVRMW